MRIVALEREILVLELEDVCDGGVELQQRQRAGNARELFTRLIKMVEIEMGVAESVDQIAGLQPAHLRDHQGEQRIRRYVERYTEKEIGAALVELTGQRAIR